MTEQNYSRAAWLDALNRARDNDWCPVDTGKAGGGELDGWICDEWRGRPLMANNGTELTDDDDVLEAAILVRTEHGGASTELIFRTIEQWTGGSEKDWESLAKGYAREDFTGEDNPEDTGWAGFHSEDDYRKWFMANGVRDHEKSAVPEDSPCRIWFDLDGSDGL